MCSTRKPSGRGEIPKHILKAKALKREIDLKAGAKEMDDGVDADSLSEDDANDADVAAGGDSQFSLSTPHGEDDVFAPFDPAIPLAQAATVNDTTNTSGDGERPAICLTSF